MKKLLFLFALTCFTGICFINAQTSVKDDHAEIMKIKGKWTRDPNGNRGLDPDFPKSQYAFAYKRMDSLTAMLKYSYPDPTGLEAIHYSYVCDRPLFKTAPTAYSHSSLYKPYYFNKNLNKMILGDETNTWVYMYINFFGWFFESQTEWNIDDKLVKVYTLRPRDGEWNGLPAYKKETRRGERTVMLTHDGKLPYKPLTQKDFLSALRRGAAYRKQQGYAGQLKLEKGKKENIEKARNNKYMDAATKERTIASLQKDYESYMSRQDEYIKKSNEFYDKKIKIIDDYTSSHSEQEMQQAAMTTNPYDFTGKFGPDGRGRVYELVRIDYSYFKKDLPRYIPQFIVLYWTWGYTELPGKEFKRQFEENFPIERLKEWIDK